MSEFRVVPTAALSATTIALVLFVTLNPRAAMWACVVALVLAVCGLFTLASEAMELRTQLDDADRRNDDLAEKLLAADQENAILAGRLEDVAPVPHLYVVPEQRDGTHDRIAMSRAEWAAIERETRDI